MILGQRYDQGFLFCELFVARFEAGVLFVLATAFSSAEISIDLHFLAASCRL